MRIPGAPDDRFSRSGICLDFGSALGGAASAAGSVVGAGIGAIGQSSAASTEAKQYAQSAANLGKAGESSQSFLNPYVAGGTAEYKNELSNPTFGNVSTNYLDNAYDSTTQASNVDNTGQASLDSERGILNNLANGGITAQTIQNLPGYQATLQLGESAVTNSAAARGLGNSGAALRGAADYATTQAQNGYQNLVNDDLSTASQFGQNASGYQQAAANQLAVANNYLGVNSGFQGNVTNTFNRENALAGYGATASQESAQNALAAAGASNVYGTSGANALAAGTTGTANALGGGLANAGNSYQAYQLYNQLLNGGVNPTAAAAMPGQFGTGTGVLPAGFGG